MKIFISTIAFLIILIMLSCSFYIDQEVSAPISDFEFETDVSPTAAPTPTPVIEPLEPFTFDEGNPDYREAMRRWVIKIGEKARERDEDFLLIPQNCSPLFTISGNPDGEVAYHFLFAIDGVGRESLCFGSGGYGKKRKYENTVRIISRLEAGTKNGIEVLSIDYCKSLRKKSYATKINNANGFIGFQAKSIELRDIPKQPPQYSNSDDIEELSDAKNFLCVINPGAYKSKNSFIDALTRTDYDILIIDAFFDSDEAIEKSDVERLRYKANGGKRLVISYLSIGEAEDYRYYWQEEWYENPPEWLLDENENWEGNYIVKYWSEEWQDIIATGEDSSLAKILDSGFDGVYLDIVDGYANFE